MSAGTLTLGIAGLVLLVGGGELLVRGASKIAVAAGLSPLVVGLTVVAFGTSAPELAVSSQAALSGRADLAIGNVVGSNIFNVLFILGLSAVITPLAVHTRLVRREIPLMIGSAVLLLVLGLDGGIGRWDGVLLLAGAVGYAAWTVRASRRETGEARAAEELSPGQESGTVERTGLLLAGVSVLAGLALLVLGARWLVDAAVGAARSLGVDEFTIGVTIVAAGTSLPEVAASVIAAVRGQRDIAVGNVVGSNLFNVLGILGAAGLMAPEGVGVAAEILRFDVPVMIAVSVACLPILFTGWTISRLEGLVFLAYYGAYVAYLLLAQQAHAVLPAFSRTMWLFVLPVTAIVLAMTAWRSARS